MVVGSNPTLRQRVALGHGRLSTSKITALPQNSLTRVSQRRSQTRVGTLAAITRHRAIENPEGDEARGSTSPLDQKVYTIKGQSYSIMIPRLIALRAAH